MQAPEACPSSCHLAKQPEKVEGMSKAKSSSLITKALFPSSPARSTGQAVVRRSQAHRDLWASWSGSGGSAPPVWSLKSYRQLRGHTKFHPLPKAGCHGETREESPPSRISPGPSTCLPNWVLPLSQSLDSTSF